MGAEGLLDAGGGLLVALDQVQDPQNLGSICRTAECAGADGVLIPERRAAEVTPAVCKASAGAVEHLPVARVQERRRRRWARPARPATGATGRALRRRPGAVRRSPTTGPTTRGAGSCSCSGSEGKGLRPRVAGACDELIALPQRGRIESLGVAAAAAALLYEILQSRSASLDNAT